MYIYRYIYIIRFHVAVRLFSNRSQMKSKCVNNKKVAHEVRDLLLNRCMTTWNLFVFYNKELNIQEKSLFISNFATLTDMKIAL